MSNKHRGRVIRTDAKVCQVDVDGEVVQAAPRGKLFDALREAGNQVKNPIAVGDWVLLDLEGDPVSVEEVLPRTNYIGRTASSHDPREQVLVSNIDRFFLIASVNRPGFSSNRTDRILAACHWHEVPAVLVLNKVDLGREGEIEALRATYEQAGVEVLETCAIEAGDQQRSGIDELRERLVGQVSVFYGASGAGKSSLLNALEPQLALKVGKISKYWKGGKHTTSHSTLLQIDSIGPRTWVIDTPGIRVFRLHGVHQDELRDLFPDFAAFQKNCFFATCTHDHEPDCAVAEAVEEGQIAETRYASYLEIKDELDPPRDDDTPVEPPEGGVFERD